MKTYNELLIEKTKIRITNPNRHSALNMILDGASKLAKKEQVEVTESHLFASVRSLIGSTESVIELLKQKNALTENYELELKEYKEFLGPQVDDVAIYNSISEILIAFPTEERVKKNMKNIMTMVKSLPALEKADPKAVNRILATMLK